VYGPMEGLSWITNPVATSIDVNSTAAGCPVTIDSNAGADTVNVNETTAGAPVTLASNVGDDTVTVNSTGVGSATALFNATQRIGALSIATGGVAQLTTGGAKVLSTTSMS